MFIGLPWASGPNLPFFCCLLLKFVLSHYDLMMWTITFLKLWDWPRWGIGILHRSVLSDLSCPSPHSTKGVSVNTAGVLYLVLRHIISIPLFCDGMLQACARSEVKIYLLAAIKWVCKYSEASLKLWWDGVLFLTSFQSGQWMLPFWLLATEIIPFSASLMSSPSYKALTLCISAA